MNRTAQASISILTLVVAVGLLAGAAAAATHTVNQVNLTFDPDEITINVGDTVEWIWSSGIHTVTNGLDLADPDLGTLFDEPLTAANPVVSYAFTAAGDVPYLCRPHVTLGMTGVVHVLDPTAAPGLTPGGGGAPGTERAQPLQSAHRDQLRPCRRGVWRRRVAGSVRPARPPGHQPVASDLAGRPAQRRVERSRRRWPCRGLRDLRLPVAGGRPGHVPTHGAGALTAWPPVAKGPGATMAPGPFFSAPVSYLLDGLHCSGSPWSSRSASPYQPHLTSVSLPSRVASPARSS